MDEIKLQPFSGADALCPKCNSKGASTKYISQGMYNERIQVNGDLFMLDGSPECLFRTCNVCGYEWLEKTYS